MKNTNIVLLLFSASAAYSSIALISGISVFIFLWLCGLALAYMVFLKTKNPQYIAFLPGGVVGFVVSQLHTAGIMFHMLPFIGLVMTTIIVGSVTMLLLKK